MAVNSFEMFMSELNKKANHEKEMFQSMSLIIAGELLMYWELQDEVSTPKRAYILPETDEDELGCVCPAKEPLGHETLALLRLAGFAAYDGAPGTEFITNRLWDAPLCEIKRRFSHVYGHIASHPQPEKMIKYRFLEKFYFCRSIFEQYKKQHYEAAMLLLRDREISSQGIKELFSRWGSVDYKITNDAFTFALNNTPLYSPAERQADFAVMVS